MITTSRHCISHDNRSKVKVTPKDHWTFVSIFYSERHGSQQDDVSCSVLMPIIQYWRSRRKVMRFPIIHYNCMMATIQKCIHVCGGWSERGAITRKTPEIRLVEFHAKCICCCCCLSFCFLINKMSVLGIRAVYIDCSTYSVPIMYASHSARKVVIFRCRLSLNVLLQLRIVYSAHGERERKQ